ncbi:MAG: MliC family protein [Candidatus Sabulitectum sp.]|nr:MliC family protein [Candidatus Sabulitectum sp.]
MTLMKYLMALIVFSVSSLGLFKEDSLIIIHSSRYHYADQSRNEAIIDYFLFLDSSLCFVKLLLSGIEFTLPQTVTGSGVRYSDGMDLTWWERADSTLVQRRDFLGAGSLLQC